MPYIPFSTPYFPDPLSHFQGSDSKTTFCYGNWRASHAVWSSHITWSIVTSHDHFVLQILWWNAMESIYYPNFVSYLCSYPYTLYKWQPRSCLVWFADPSAFSFGGGSGNPKTNSQNQGVVTYTSPVEAFATGIKNFDRWNSSLIAWSLRSEALDRLILREFKGQNVATPAK